MLLSKEVKIKNIFFNYAEAEESNYSQNIEITKQIMGGTYLDDSLQRN